MSVQDWVACNFKLNRDLRTAGRPWYNESMRGIMPSWLHDQDEVHRLLNQKGPMCLLPLGLQPQQPHPDRSHRWTPADQHAIQSPNTSTVAACNGCAQDFLFVWVSLEGGPWCIPFSWIWCKAWICDCSWLNVWTCVHSAGLECLYMKDSVPLYFKFVVPNWYQKIQYRFSACPPPTNTRTRVWFQFYYYHYSEKSFGGTANTVS